MPASTFDLNQLLTTVVTVIPIGVGFVWAIKSDTRVLRTRLDAMDSKLDSVDKRFEKLDGVLVSLAESSGRMDRLDDRLVNVSQREADLHRRFNEYVDSRDDSTCPAVRPGRK
jgi:hypothetical protein